MAVRGSLRLLRRTLRSRLRTEERGFTLVELMVALGVILTSMVTLAYTASVGFKDVALARQRDSANGLANQVMEQVRALPFDTIKHGLANSDLPGGDSAIVSVGCPSGGAYCYRSSATAPLENIPRGVNPNVVPLVPHKATVTVGPTTYTRAVYITYYNNDATLNAFRVTVVVSWSNAARHGVATSVTAQTILYSPAGCLSTATHPFAAPCQPFFFGSVQNDPGAIQVTGTLTGVNLANAMINFPKESSNMQVEQISSVKGSVTTAGATLQIVNGSVQTVGSATAGSAADNDPSQPSSDYQTNTASSSGGTLLAAGSNNAVSLSVGTGSTGSTTSTTSASTSHPCNAQTDGQPCGISTASQTATISATTGLNSGFLALGTANLVSLTAYGTTGTTDRALDASGDGRVAVTGTRTIGDLRVGGLPSSLSALILPVGWQGYLVRLNGYTDTVSAQTGVNTTAPAVTTAGTLQVWNGIGYTNVPINTGSSVNVPVTTVTVQDPLSPGGLLKVVLSATVRTGGTGIASTVKTCTPTACPNTRTAASATAASPIIADVRIQVTLAGNSIADLIAHVDLGTISATGTYQEAPSA